MRTPLNDDIIGQLQAEIKELKEALQRIQMQKNPTLPEYNPAALPADLPNNSVFIGTDNTLRFYHNGVLYNAGP